MGEAVISVSVLALLTAMGLYMSVKSTSWTTLFMLPAVILVSYVAIFEASSLGKPLHFEWRNWQETEVLSTVIVEGSGIYLWLRVDGDRRPKYYALPYDKRTAMGLARARGQQAEGEEGEYRIILRRDTVLDQEPTFHAEPQRPNPPKFTPPFGPPGRPGGGPDRSPGNQ